MKKLFAVLVAFCTLFVFAPVAEVQGQMIMFNDFESGWGDWYADNGLWEVGKPTAPDGPSAFSGENVAGTVLGGNILNRTNSRLISPPVTLPPVQQGERIQLKYQEWHYFRASYGKCYIQISVDRGETWKTVSATSIDRGSRVWSQNIADLTDFADLTVQVGFFAYDAWVELGWYIDDVRVEKTSSTMPNPEGFESGWGDWYADNGLWEVGKPTAPDGPRAFSGQNVAGTVLSGNFAGPMVSRLISPPITLPAVSPRERIQLKYQEWHDLLFAQGTVQVSIDRGETWKTVSATSIDRGSRVWSQNIADLTDLAGYTLRIGFQLYAQTQSGRGLGWYIDDIQLETTSSTMPNPEGFESGWGDWYADNGLWEVGKPTAPDGPRAFSGQNVAGTVLSGNFAGPMVSRLISPPITLPAVSPRERIQLKYQEWHDLQFALGTVQISVEGTGVWQSVTKPVQGGSTNWSQGSADLTDLAGYTLRIGFQLYAQTQSGRGLGWYIDDVEWKIVPVTSVNDESDALPNIFALHQNYPNPFNPSTEIRFELPKASHVVVKIYNMVGQEARTLVDAQTSAGRHSVVWNGRDQAGNSLPSDVYFYRLEAGEFVKTMKMVLAK